ncbi:Pentatricopeptide repeat-containing protein [Actinidia chinensis var. chinensis]|uniref:Pentatricopeptide repeat-containing protein n=1 Tax=Actinidia chinensis var. chinensis TaxID=1590841 RepID=A0A2R6QN00_ACTCC|nr:Pentatricopeptide repeat-containing protein [Actinidia chinensis var. chinensis]
MTLNLGSPRLFRLSLPSSHSSKLFDTSSYSSAKNSSLFFLVFNSNCASKRKFSSALSGFKKLRVEASLSESENEVAEASDSELLDEDLIRRVSAAKDANEGLELIAEKSKRGGGVVSGSDCCSIISAAFDRNNADLALSVYSAMRSSFDPGLAGGEMASTVQRWKWSRPDVHTCTLLVQGLAASLRVSDALKMIGAVSRVGVSPGEEVPFGKIVRCPTCMIAVTVAQPQHGIQVVSCSKCRYQYELVSGNIVSIESEEISMEVPAWKRALRFLQIKMQSIPAAVHSIVVETPSGMARTHRFATETVDLPAQEGERVTIAVAAPSNVYREVGPLKFSPKSPNFYPGEPMCLTNHRDGRESLLLRAPIKNGGTSLLNPSILFPLLAVLATGDAASGFIDPSLPQFISVAAVSSVALGATLNTLVFPQLGRIPQRLVDTIAIKQQLLSQYDRLQSRIKGLKEGAENEVWMLARMCQLENKITAVGEPSYRARRSRVRRVREGLESSLRKRIELIDSYARISSMIEIEVEMDSDVLAAEAASNAESIAEQIQQIMELENLEETWRIQIEANDEVERLLSSETTSSEQVLDI